MALFDFTAAGAGELSLAVGDTVELLGRVDEAWLRGRVRGKEGIFPAQFVEVKVDLPASASEGDDGRSRALYDFDGQAGELSFKVCIYMYMYTQFLLNCAYTCTYMK